MCIDKQVDFCKKVTFTAIVHPIYLTTVSTYSTCDTLKEHIHMYTRDTFFQYGSQFKSHKTSEILIRNNKITNKYISNTHRNI